MAASSIPADDTQAVPSPAPQEGPPAPGESFGSGPPRLLAVHWDRWRLWQRLLLAIVLAAALSGVGYAAFYNYPDTSLPRGTVAEERIAAVFGIPDDTDGVITGDLLVERFYVLDSTTGDQYVADILKGRVQGVQESTNENGQVMYSLLLDLNNLQRDSALLGAFIEEVAAPEADGGYYLGLRVLPGLKDAFMLNYDGLLPNESAEFRGPRGEDIYTYLVGQRFSDVSLGARLVNSEGTNYLLSNTDLFPYFKFIFRLDKAVIISRLIVVDLTSHEQTVTYFRLLNQYPRTATPAPR